MEKNRKYQIIGSCLKPQAVSFDDQLTRIASIFYEISFEYRFADYCVDEEELTVMPTGCIIELIKKTEADYVYEDTTAHRDKLATINNDVQNVVYTEKEYNKLIKKEKKRIKRARSNELLQKFWDGYYEGGWV